MLKLYFAFRGTTKNPQSLELCGFCIISGGQGEIRTHGTPKRTLDFESSAFDHSATCPICYSRFTRYGYPIKRRNRLLVKHAPNGSKVCGIPSKSAILTRK